MTDLSPLEKKILDIIKNVGGKKNVNNLIDDEIIPKCKISRPTAFKILKLLEEKGEIIAKRGYHSQEKHYEINMDKKPVLEVEYPYLINKLKIDLIISDQFHNITTTSIIKAYDDITNYHGGVWDWANPLPKDSLKFSLDNKKINPTIYVNNPFCVDFTMPLKKGIHELIRKYKTNYLPYYDHAVTFAPVELLIINIKFKRFKLSKTPQLHNPFSATNQIQPLSKIEKDNYCIELTDLKPYTALKITW